MGIWMKLARSFVALMLCLGCAGLVAGCPGSKEEKAINNAVDDLSGKTTVEVGNRLKKQIDDVTAREVEKVRDESARTPGDEESGEGEDQ